MSEKQMRLLEGETRSVLTLSISYSISIRLNGLYDLLNI